MINYEMLKCPKCHKSDVEVTGSSDDKFNWDYNHNCFARTIWAYCSHCNCDFTVNELWDCVGFDEDSITIKAG